MLLVAGPHPDFIRFVQVICWIILPVLISAVIIAIYLDRRKKRQKTIEEKEVDPSQGFPQQLGYTNGNGDYVLFDHSDLMQQYRRKLSYSHARYSALQRDLDAMDTKYAALANFVQTHFKTPKEKAMANKREQLPEDLQAAINKLAETEAMERKSLLDKLAQLEKSHLRLEDENRTLKEQLTMDTATDEQRSAIINKWKEENTRLKDKIEHHEYLEDVVEEKKAQVNFLQNQLEQRIMNLYQSEHSRLKAIAESKQLAEEKETIKKDLESLKNDLMLNQERIDKTQVVLCEKEELLTEKQQLVNEKADHITQLENMLRESREQGEQMNIEITDARDEVTSLHHQLNEERARVQFLTQKLLTNKQMLRQLYKEFSAYVEDGAEESQVVLTTSDPNKTNEDIVMR